MTGTYSSDVPKAPLKIPIFSGYREYDNECPHSSLGDLTPLEYMSKLIEGVAQQANMEALSGPENGQDPQGLAYPEGRG